MTASPVELPQLPSATSAEGYADFPEHPEFTAHQMRAYGQQCYEAGVRAERERAAQIALSFANCGCDGKHGYCTVDDPPKDIAAAIRKGE